MTEQPKATIQDLTKEELQAEIDCLNLLPHNMIARIISEIYKKELDRQSKLGVPQ